MGEIPWRRRRTRGLLAAACGAAAIAITAAVWSTGHGEPRRLLAVACGAAALAITAAACGNSGSGPAAAAPHGFRRRYRTISPVSSDR